MGFGGGSPPPLPAIPPPPAPPPPLGQPQGTKPGAKAGGPFRTVIGSGEMGIAPGFGLNTSGPGSLGGSSSATLGGSSK